MKCRTNLRLIDEHVPQDLPRYIEQRCTGILYGLGETLANPKHLF